MCPALAMAWSERDLSSGDLHGTLTMPEGDGKVPAVLILPGSGPVDRDGNLPGAPNNSLKLLAHALADQGVASLRIDKRGIGASSAVGVREADLRIQVYVQDTVGWASVLSKQDRVDRLALLGHSEGALIATLAAQNIKPSGLILLAGASEPAAATIQRQLQAAGLSASLQDASRRIMSALEKGEPVPDVPAELAALFRPSVQNYLMSWLPLDPAKELSKVGCPVLIVQGTNDLQITVDDAHRLLAARPSSEMVIVPGMNHVLKEASTERSANLETYSNPAKPISPLLAPAIVTFLRNL